MVQNDLVQSYWVLANEAECILQALISLTGSTQLINEKFLPWTWLITEMLFVHCLLYKFIKPAEMFSLYFKIQNLFFTQRLI